MPIDPSQVTWDAAPAIDSSQVKWDAPSTPNGFWGGLYDSAKADLQAVPGRLANLAAGGVRGAGSIGATILAPYDMALDAINGDRGKNLSYLISGRQLPTRNQERRADMDAALQSFGADPNSLQFKAGKLGAEVAGTAGIGGAVANGLRFAAPIAPSIINPLATAIETGGFSTGAKLPALLNMPTRVVGGAISGGLTAGMVNPDDAKTGALIGGALPIVGKVAGAAGDAVASVVNAFRQAKTPQEVKIAQNLAQQLGVTADQLEGAITGPQMIPGYQPTVPQIAQNPVASQLQRSLQTSGQQALADAGRTQQAQFRDALGRIAPAGTSVQDAADRAGTAIQGFARPAEANARANVAQLFDAIPSNQAVMQLPLPQMQAAQTRFTGPGTFGKGNGLVEQAMQTATNIGVDPLTHIDPRAVPFNQIQALRSSIGEAIGTAQANGQNQAAAALTQMKNAIDNKVADVAAGNALPGEVFTPQAIDAWGQALNAHAAKMQQFGTGPQAAMFRMGADGQPAIQGAEIPGKFFNGNRSQVEDMQSFQRLIGNRDDLAREMKSYALTQGLDTATQNGNLAQRFLDWMQSRSGATRQLFNPQELATLNQVGDAVQRQIAAENLGRVTGSDTAQKLASLQSNGMLDSKVVDVLGRRIPIVGHFTGPALDALRAQATTTRNGLMAGLLADPQRMADAMRKAPGLLNFDPIPLGLLTGGARVAPLLSAD